MVASIETRAPASRPPSWAQQLRDAVRDPTELADLLDLPAAARTRIDRLPGTFPLLAPRSFVARMRKGDPDDPLLRQVLPLSVETEPISICFEFKQLIPKYITMVVITQK